MCGIIGINANENVAEQLVEGLKRLEYRGYDSAGIACIDNKVIATSKELGKVAQLEQKLKIETCDGYIGIAHTRWATHGQPNTINAHPHSTTKVSIVHNGIIENYDIIKAILLEEGIEFVSDTDSEVILRLIDKYLNDSLSPFEATSKAITQLKGAFAIVAIFADYPDTMIATKKSAPIAVGLEKNGSYAGSDAYSLASFTDKVIYLENDDIAVLTKESVNIFDIHGNRVARNEVILDKTVTDHSKGPFAHYMLKEIFEQPTVAKRCIDQANINLDFLPEIRSISIIACGTSYFAGFVAKYWLEDIAKIPCNIEIASEFRSRSLPLAKDTLAIFVSQSGETADTLASLALAKEYGCPTLAIVNTEQSSMAREADHFLPIYAGIEIGVASTKAFTAQLITLAQFTLKLGILRKSISLHEYDAYYNLLQEVPGRISDALNHEEEIKSITAKLANSDNVIYIGRGSYYPIALEGALKLKEISYIHAEAVAAGELKHGSIALIDENMYVVSIAPYNKNFEKMMSNILAVAARKGKIILISTMNGYSSLKDICSESVIINHCDDFIAPIIYNIPLQLLAYHTANFKNLEIDQPRNLAKSVTVE